MKEVVASNIRIARPAIETATVRGLLDDPRKPLTYGWCDIEQFRRAVNYHLQKFGDSINDSFDLFSRFGILNDSTDDGKALHTWTNFSVGELKGEPPPGDLSRYGIRVPAGWVIKVMHFVENGFVKFWSVPDNQFSGLFIEDKQFPLPYWIIGLKYSGEEFKIDKNGYRLLTEHLYDTDTSVGV